MNLSKLFSKVKKRQVNRPRAASTPDRFRSLRIEPLEERTLLSGTDLSGIDVFALNSNPGAKLTIYLDFTGHQTTGTGWNSSTYDKNYDPNNPNAPIVTPVFSVDSEATFNETEKGIIYEVWERVSEDYYPFNVNVTTVDPGDDSLIWSGGSDEYYGIRVCIGGEYSDWYNTNHGAGGVAFVSSFKSSNDNAPCFVFAKTLSNNARYIAESAAHEVGHTLGLQHDGDSINEYYPGTSTWASIMGSSYDAELTQWSKGEYADAYLWVNGVRTNQFQNDLQVIASILGYRSDDYGNSRTATNIGEIGVLSSSTSMSGFIGETTDVDFFSFSTDNLTGKLLSIGGLEGITNLDVLVTLYNSSGVLINTYNPTDTLYVEMDLTELSGSYYLSVEGTGRGSPLDSDGYSDYASLGCYTIEVIDKPLPVAELPDLQFYTLSQSPYSWPASAFLYSGANTTSSQTVFSTTDDIYLAFSWWNNGYKNLETGPFTIQVSLDDDPYMNYNSNSLGYQRIGYTGSNPCYVGTYLGNDSGGKPRYAHLVPGEYTIKVTLDSAKAVEESDETNNVYTIGFSVHEPWSTDISLSNSLLGAGATEELIGLLSTTDPYTASTGFTYSLVSGDGDTDNEYFVIENDQLSIGSTAVELGEYSVRIRATSELGYYYEETITLTACERPKVALQLESFEIQPGTSFYIAAVPDETGLDATALTWLWDLGGEGSGDFVAVDGNDSAFWLRASDYYDPDDDTVVIRMKAIDTNGISSAVQSVSLTMKTEPTRLNFSTRVYGDDALVRLSLNAIPGISGHSPQSWTVYWDYQNPSDLGESFRIPTLSLTLHHFYKTSGSKNVCVRLDGGDLYYLTMLIVSPKESASVLPDVVDTILAESLPSSDGSSRQISSDWEEQEKLLALQILQEEQASSQKRSRLFIEDI